VLGIPGIEMDRVGEIADRALARFDRRVVEIVLRPAVEDPRALGGGLRGVDGGREREEQERDEDEALQCSRFLRFRTKSRNTYAPMLFGSVS
jgi:hypothetical protein